MLCVLYRGTMCCVSYIEARCVVCLIYRHDVLCVLYRGMMCCVSYIEARCVVCLI